jgi:hypothetical protein
MEAAGAMLMVTSTQFHRWLQAAQTQTDAAERSVRCSKRLAAAPQAGTYIEESTTSIPSIV